LDCFQFLEAVDCDLSLTTPSLFDDSIFSEQRQLTGKSSALCKAFHGNWSEARRLNRVRLAKKPFGLNRRADGDAMGLNQGAGD